MFTMYIPHTYVYMYELLDVTAIVFVAVVLLDLEGKI